MPRATILVLEDDSDMHALVVEALEDAGYDPRGAHRAEEAIDAAKMTRFDVFITDIRMARMDGLQALEIIREYHPDQKTIVITGFASDEAPTRAIRLQASDYLYKPFSLKELLASVERLLAAEQERNLYRDLLAAVQSFVVDTVATLTSVELYRLEAVRDRAFRGFYVAVRSEKLNADSARAVWDVLESVEVACAKLQISEGTGPDQDLLDGYSYVIELNEALSRTPRTHYPGQARLHPALTQRDFRVLYDGIRKGSLSVEMLKIAPCLRTSDPEVLGRNPSLHKLLEGIWGLNPR